MLIVAHATICPRSRQHALRPCRRAGKLAQLEYLDVSHNSLVSVPNDLALCRQLWFLAMAHNKVCAL